MSGQNVTAESLVGLLGGAVNGQTAEIPLPLRYGKWNLKLKGVADLNDSLLRMAAIRPEAQIPELPKVKDSVSSLGLLLSISGDLSPLFALPEDHPSRGIFKRVEQFHHLFELPKMTPEGKEIAETPTGIRPKQRWEPSPENFQSILDEFTGEEDWSFHLEVKTDSHSQLKVSVEVGEGLWTYWRCREYMSQGPPKRQ